MKRCGPVLTVSATCLVVLGLGSGAVMLGGDAPAPPAARGVTLYDPDPGHLWNRLHDALRVRLVAERDGEEVLLEAEDASADTDDLDPMLWRTTWHFSRYLLTGPADSTFKKRPRKKRDAHREALARLDEFLDKGGEKLVRDPLRRALLQRDLWALFDSFADPIWSHWWPSEKEPTPPLYPRERRALLTRLARALPRLALSREEIRRLPDNYAEAVKSGITPAAFDPRQKSRPFLPADLWRAEGPWVVLGEPGDQPLARDHTRFFGGRSAFLIFLCLPEGRKQTVEYVERLREAAQKRETDLTRLQFPTQTQVALVRRTLLLDIRGAIVPSPLTESVQIRVFHHPGRRVMGKDDVDTQTFIEYRLRRRDLLAGKAGGLFPAGPKERERAELLFYGFNHDSGREPILASCRGCHSDPGIESVNSYVGRSLFGSHGRACLSSSTVAEEERGCANWKKRQATWGLLEGLWGGPK